MFRPILQTTRLIRKGMIKPGMVLRTHYGEDLHVKKVEWISRKGCDVTADRKFEGKDVGTIRTLYGLNWDFTAVIGYTEGDSKQVWTMVRSEIHDGHWIAMYRTYWGRGKSRIGKWVITYDGEERGWASIPEDAEVNFLRVASGLKYNSKTGEYEQAED